jgi:outer membrane protein insertion porin family
MRAMERLISPVRRTAVALLLLCGAVVYAQAPTGKVTVDDVIPQGNHNVPPQRIVNTIKTRPGLEFSQDVLDEDVRRLYETKLFANVRTYIQRTPDNKVKVYFVVAEFPTLVQEVVYNGAKHLKAEDLEQLTGIRKGAPLNPIQNQMAKQAILRRYIEDGRLFASVDLVEGDKPGDTRVVFNITEGKVVKVSKIRFEGNSSFVSGARLNTQVDSTHRILWLFGGRYDPITADHDVTKLEEYYKSFGYHDVMVSRELQWDENGQTVSLVFHIHEGQRYKVASIQLEGNKALGPDLLLTHIKQASGEWYDKGKVTTDINKIKDDYGYRGMGVTVREEDFYPAPGQVAVHYEVQERPAARVADIKIAGNEVTKDNVILRQIPIYPGQTLTYPDLRLAEKNLARLNIFEMNPATGIRPTVSVIDPDSDTLYKDLLVQVQETPTGSLMFGVGVNSDAGLTGSIALNERNFDICRWPTSFDDLLSGHAFRGAGQEFRIEALPGTQVQRYSATFREPFLFDSMYSLSTSVYYFDRIYNEYTESRLGTRLTIGRKLNQYWSVSGTLRLEDVGVHDVPYYEPEDFQEVLGDHFLGGFRPSIQRDTRDSYLRPTEGSLIEASYEQFFGDYSFPQINLQASKYFTMYQRADGSGRHVLALRSQVGWTGDNTPVFERFYAGGFASLRGFEFRGVGPDVEGYKIGGDFLFLNSIEYQIPILANDYLWAVAFVDSGTVERSVELNDYRVSAGFGLRILVPMLGPVPIALDFGFPIVRANTDREQVFSFWVGFFH